MTDAVSVSAGRLRSAPRAGIVGGCFGLAALGAFRWWERWDRGQECTGIFSDCLNQSLGPLWLGVPVLLLAGWLGLGALRVNRPWLVVLVAVPLNGITAVATQAAEPRLVAVVAVSAATWAIGGVVAAPRTAS